MQGIPKSEFEVGGRKFVTKAALDLQAGRFRVWVENKDGGLVTATYPNGYLGPVEIEDSLDKLDPVENGEQLTVDHLVRELEERLRGYIEQGWA